MTRIPLAFLAAILSLAIPLHVFAQQDVNFDDLLSELSFGDEDTVAEDASATGEAAQEAAADAVEAVEEVAPEAGAGVVEAAEEVALEPVEEVTAEAPEAGVVEVVEDAAPAFSETEWPAPAVAPAEVEDTVATEFDATGDFAAPAQDDIAAEPAEVVEEAVAAEIAEPAPVVTLTEAPDDEAKANAKLMAQQEEVRRQAREVEAQKNFEAGMAAFAEGRYEQSVKLLEDAQRELPVRTATEAMRNQISITLGDCYINLARERMETDINFARRNIDLALAAFPENRKAQSLEKRIAARERRIAEEVARPRSVMEQTKYADKYTQIDQLLRDGRDLFDAREYNDAEMAFERVMQLDEYNIEAMRFLRKIEETRYDLRTREREATVAEMMAMVRDTWNPPIRTDVVAPSGAQQQTQVEALTAQQQLQKKMESIVIPSIEFRQANIADVVNFLVDASVAGDPNGIGVNIILKLTGSAEAAAPAPAPAPAAPAGFDSGFGGGFGEFDSGFGEAPAAAVPGASSVPAITLNLRRINLLDAVKYITEVADLRYRLEDNVVVITPANVVSGRVVTRMYPVQPSILDVIVERGEAEPAARDSDFIGMGGAQTTVRRTDVKDFFERAGVPFPVGTSITYNQSISQLIVANTVENLETFERILSRLNVIPNQVEIEARFVEVNQSNLEELGFQWFLTDNWEIAQKKGGAFPAATESIIMAADPQGLTKGNRFFGQDVSSGSIGSYSTPTLGSATPLGGIATFASVLTNPELQVIINALSQMGNADLLSAPRVTTRSGVNAQIQIVDEIIYPTEFNTEVTSLQSETEGGATVTERFVVVEPGQFTTREVGVILNVTPTVGPDGYTIDLTLSPEVAELIDWIQYGSEYGQRADGTPIRANIIQPTFSSRNVTTSIVVWDGQTVVMGGLIREDLVKYEDKIPILGDIPILGRLFRSEGEHSQKKNLLIFVTARLVGPDGRPLNRGEGGLTSPEAPETAAVPK